LDNANQPWHQWLGPVLLGARLSFIARLLGLRLLSRVLDGGRRLLFGFYCLALSAIVLWVG